MAVTVIVLIKNLMKVKLKNLKNQRKKLGVVNQKRIQLN